ncbi:MAG TPA: 16S rRNA (cytidine(1402)-2'-O)-methyltransferase [Pyrinomonadaceae bacterium]|jgi:16S rRNA (cytidine1402-2'-O)-methyltransferase
MSSTLYIVATPIGNLEDITHRAIRILGEVDLIACEDTRHTRKLLNHFGINTKTISYHDHNETERAPELLRELEKGSDVALVSDAGTPGISDPGFRIVRLCLERGISVVPVPGPTAFVSALVASGFPTDEFFFAGFLPAKKNQRRAKLNELSAIDTTLVFYEAPHRIAETLKDAREVLGERKAVVARELTKLHEEIRHGTLSELETHFASGERARGEMVLVIDRTVTATAEAISKETIGELVAQLEAEGIDSRAALKQAAKRLGISRDEAYRRMVAERIVRR